MRPRGVEGSFVLSLAERVELRLAVLVSRTRSSRSVWITEPGDAAEIAQLEALGRRWLRSIDLTTSQPAADLDLGLPAETVSVAPVPGEQGEVQAVLVAVKQDGRTWSGAERELLRFAAEHYRAALGSWLERPQPHLAARAPAVRAPLAVTPREGELVLDYQPEVELATGRVLGAEALVRWDSPQHGLVGPERFIGAAEQSGLIEALGAWVIDRSLRDFAGWQARGAPADLVLRINVSPLQIAGGHVVSRFRRALEQYGVAGTQVCAEITENLRVADTEQLAATVRELAALGVHTALDDLATGYSSLGRLRSMPVDTVKLDRALVTGIDQDERGRLIVVAVLNLCAELGVDVVAEGIETPGELATLVELGCRRGQGHQLARPMPAAELERLLRRGSTGQFVPGPG